MIQNVIEGISTALYSAFGETHAIYAERVEQGLTPPCFSIGLLSCEAKPQIGGRTRYTLPFQVLYFPPDGSDRPALWEAGQKLRATIAVIDAGGLRLRGTRIKTDQLEGVLRCVVQYQVVLTERDSVELMGTYHGVQQMKPHE